MKTYSLKTKLQSVGFVLTLVSLLLGINGIVGIKNTNQGMETVYLDRVVPLQQLKTIADEYAVSIIDAVNKANAGLFTAEQTVAGIDNASATIKRNWNDYMATKLTEKEAVLAKQASELFVPADKAISNLRSFLGGKQGSVKGKLDDFDGPLYEQIDPISGKITDLVSLQLSVAKDEYTAAHEQFNTTLLSSLILLFVGVTVGSGVGWSVVKSTTHALNAISSTLSEGSTLTWRASQEVSAASQSLAEGASEQAASLEETSASLEQIASMTKRNSENAINASRLGKQSRESAQSGLERINELSATLNGIKTAVAEMQEAVTEMQTSNQQVSKIIKTIDEIAFQTNLLALNAAVEAARTGEAGMGFAVVADEVRALAQRSAQAAKDTTEKIDSAVKRSERGVGAANKVVVHMAEVESSTRSIQQVFDGIVSQIQSLDSIVAEIAAATKEQSQGVGEVNMAVSQMDKITQSNAAGAEENAASASQLLQQANQLKEIVLKLDIIVQGSQTTPNSVAIPQSAVSPVRSTHSLPSKHSKQTTILTGNGSVNNGYSNHRGNGNSGFTQGTHFTGSKQFNTGSDFSDLESASSEIPMPPPTSGNHSRGSFQSF